MNKKIIISVTAVIILLASGYFLFYQNSGSSSSLDEKQLYTCGMHPDIITDEPGNCPICEMKLTPIKKESKSTGEKKILYWRAPMDPNEIYDEPGKSKMGMDLVPVYEDEAGSSGVVTIDGAVQQNMNLKISSIQEKVLSNKISTNGVLTTDERNEYIVTTKVSGWIEKLYVNYTGQNIKKGEKLVDIYSPELVAAQQELLSAVEYSKATANSGDTDVINSGDQLINNTIKKLELLDLPESDIREIIRSKELKKYITLYSPMNGTVLMKYVTEGEKINAGKQLLHIADLSILWLKADIYEGELSKVNIGNEAKINFSYFPSKTYEGKVSFIYPTVDSKTRTVQLRIDLNNSKGDLKPEMFANVEIIGKELQKLPVINETAVIRSGMKNIAVLSLGEGKFKPVEIKLGNYSDGYYQVLSGLKTGDKIVTSAQFMIDSESSLRAAINMFGDDDMKMKSDKDENKDMKDMNDDKSMVEKDHDHSAMETETSETKDDGNIVREGTIDVEAIDKNNDGKVFQDAMDWNVISDEPGYCPICEMKLIEYTIDEAKENLKNNGFKYK